MFGFWGLEFEIMNFDFVFFGLGFRVRYFVFGILYFGSLGLGFCLEIL